MQITTIIKAAAVTAGIYITALLGGWDNLTIWLATVMLLDYITGVLVGIIKKQISSNIGFRGLLKKALILIIVSIGVCMDNVLGLGEPWIRSAVIIWYATNESISILENAAKVIDLPTWLVGILKQNQEQQGGVKK